ncbi:MAG: acylneuraminate cytidylyltransferase family protein [Phycisphaeraceae bacterium]
MTTLCIILGRAGSKGLPGKNVLPVAGRPMALWTIEFALRARSLSQVVVSTDSGELAAIGREHALRVVDRPAVLASDTATVDAAARHALEQVEAERGGRFDAVVILYANVPVRPADLADRAVAKLRDTGCDSVQSVTSVGKMHPYWMKRLTGAEEDVAGRVAGDVIEAYEANSVYRRQDLPPVYMLDGGIIAVRRESLLTVVQGQPHAFLGRDRRAVVTGPGEVVDVDSEHDRRVAEAVLTAGASGS